MSSRTRSLQILIKITFDLILGKIIEFFLLKKKTLLNDTRRHNERTTNTIQYEENNECELFFFK